MTWPRSWRHASTDRPPWFAGLAGPFPGGGAAASPTPRCQVRSSASSNRGSSVVHTGRNLRAGRCAIRDEAGRTVVLAESSATLVPPRLLTEAGAPDEELSQNA